MQRLFKRFINLAACAVRMVLLAGQGLPSVQAMSVKHIQIFGM